MLHEKESLDESQDGVSANPDHDPAAKLLLDAPIEAGENLLLIEGGCGRLAAHFAPLFKHALNQNMLYRNHQVALSYLIEQNLSGVKCLLSDIPHADSNPEYGSNTFDTILFRIGRGTTLVNAALTEAFQLLRVGGKLWVSGHAQEGIKSFAKRAELHFGNSLLLKIKSSCRLFCFIKDSEYPKTAIEDPRYFEYLNLELILPFGHLNYLSKPGIFSYRSTDIGTALLAKYLPDCTGKTVLDLGCGSGILSLAAAKLGAKSVLAIDSNVVATNCSDHNFQHQGVNGSTRCTHLTEGIEEEFDFIFSNPPFHEGHKTEYSFPGKILDAIVPKLKQDGAAYLVANEFLDYIAQGKQRNLNVEIKVRTTGYSVYRFEKSVVV